MTPRLSFPTSVLLCMQMLFFCCIDTDYRNRRGTITLHPIPTCTNNKGVHQIFVSNQERLDINPPPLQKNHSTLTHHCVEF